MSPRPRAHPGFDALVDCVVRELDQCGLTLTTELVHDELRLLLRSARGGGGLPEDERWYLLGPESCHRLAEQLRRQLHLPELPRRSDPQHRVSDHLPDREGTGARPRHGEPDASDPEPCPVVDLDEWRRREW